MLHSFFHTKNQSELKPLEGWQRRRLLSSVLAVVVIAILFLTYACVTMEQDKRRIQDKWTDVSPLSVQTLAELDERCQAATLVRCGTYLEYIKEISLKNGTFRVSMEVWFRWEGSPDLDMIHNFRFYKGSINAMDVVSESHENGVNYQMVMVDVTVSKNYTTSRFPLDNHVLNIYLESQYPVKEVRFVVDEESSMNEGLHLSGYDVVKHSVYENAYTYDSVHGNPALTEPPMTSEVVTSVLISRAGMGLYVKCFIALFGTTLWVFIALFICTYHHVDPLGMIPAALFGTVSNIMVGASLLPDALSLGLLEYVNFWGILTIIAAAVVIININRIRSKYQDKDFAKFYGRVMFTILIVCVLTGHVIMPLCAMGL